MLIAFSLIRLVILLRKMKHGLCFSIQGRADFREPAKLSSKYLYGYPLFFPIKSCKISSHQPCYVSSRPFYASSPFLQLKKPSARLVPKQLQC